MGSKIFSFLTSIAVFFIGFFLAGIIMYSIFENNLISTLAGLLVGGFSAYKFFKHNADAEKNKED